MTEIDTRTPLQLEQLEAQDGKMRDRTLADYNTILFKRPRPHIADFLGSKAAGATTIPELLSGLPSTGGEVAHWADMAGGLAVAQRQAAAMQKAGRLGEVMLTNVDLFDWTTKISKPELQSITWSSRVNLGDSAISPELIIGDASRTELPQPADLITSIQAIQYFDNPLGALAHWYNQLRDGGLMVVGRERALWSTRISVDSADQDVSPFTDLFGQFEDKGVAHAIDIRKILDGSTGKPCGEGFGVLAIQKRTGTSLRLNASPIRREVAPSGGKFVHYDDTQPALELIAA